MGIDPGQKGGITLTTPDFKEIISFRYPGSATEAADILRQFQGQVILTVLEKVGAMPKQGVSSTFKFGVNYGTYIGILEAFNIPYVLIAPAVWMRGSMDNTNKGDKYVTWHYCKRRFPEVDWGSKSVDNGRTDAMCMAKYGIKLAR